MIAKLGQFVFIKQAVRLLRAIRSQVLFRRELVAMDKASV